MSIKREPMVKTEPAPMRTADKKIRELEASLEGMRSDMARGEAVRIAQKAASDIQLQATAHEKDNQIREQRAVLEANHHTIVRLKSAVIARSRANDRLVGAKHQQIVRLEAAVAAKTRDLAHFFRELRDEEAAVDAQARTIKGLEATVGAQAKKIKRLEATVGAQPKNVKRLASPRKRRRTVLDCLAWECAACKQGTPGDKCNHLLDALAPRVKVSPSYFEEFDI